jgi:electron transfer flavoprotein beta subunit
LKEEFGGRVTVISMGPNQAKKALREAICMGADEAVLLSDKAFAGSDTLATSKVLASAVKKFDYDLIFAGRQAIDGDTAQVGPGIAEHLDLPQVTYVEKMDVVGSDLKVRRALEDGYEEIGLRMPALLTAVKELNQPRFMNIKNIFASSDDEIKVWTIDDLDVKPEELGLKGSPTKVKKSRTKEAKGQGEIINQPPKEAVKLAITKLKERHYL